MPCHRSPQGWLLLLAAALAAFAAGCASGSMPSGSQPPTLTGNTNVIVLLTSTANDRLEDLLLGIVSISLTDEHGNVVTLYSNNPSAGTLGLNEPAEFMHLNGIAEPLVTVSVPQAVYTSATVKAGYCSITEISIDSSQAINDNTWGEGLCGQGTGNIIVNLASPITINGSGMALSFNLRVPQSYTLTGAGTTATYTISPVFTLSEVPLSSQPTSNANAKITGIDAQVMSTNEAANSFVVQTPDGISLTVNSNTATVYQGIARFSSLSVGMLVNLDMDIADDASLMATRVEVDSTSAGTGIIGPLMTQIGSQTNEFVTIWLEGVGCANSAAAFCGTEFQYSGNTVFGVSGQISNLQNLPFAAVFDTSNITPGRILSVYSSGAPNQQSVQGATTILLTPQTINATVTSISNANGFAVYSVDVAPYALIPTLEGQSGNPYPAVNSPTNVVVYADSNTRMLNSSPVSLGSLLRFRGAIFYDNGTLRMDCVQVNDGVPE